MACGGSIEKHFLVPTNLYNCAFRACNCSHYFVNSIHILLLTLKTVDKLYRTYSDDTCARYELLAYKLLDDIFCLLVN